ncbi:MAG: hypothetical protein GX235_07405 [Clostridiales bacterium]|nr:hypothetical protein [Clostridiales bacterium]
MAYISQVEYEKAPNEVKYLIDKQIKENGRITNMKLTLLHSIPAYKALMEWYPLEKTIEQFLGERAVNFFCYAISTENDCLICSVFFRKILKDLNIDFDTFQFTQEEDILIRYGRAIVKDANHIPAEIFDELKEHWNEEQIVAITAFATIMIATNLINKILQVDLDDYLKAYTKD